MTRQEGFSIRKMWVPAVVMLAFWALGIVAWQSSGYLQPLLVFGYIGASIGLGLGLYPALPRKRKPLGRRLRQDLPDGHPHPRVYTPRAARAVERVHPVPDVRQRVCQGCAQAVVWIRRGRKGVAAGARRGAEESVAWPAVGMP